MRVYKPTFTDRLGNKKSASRWYLDFLDHKGRRRRIPVFGDKAQTRIFGDNLERLIECRANSREATGELAEWERGLLPRLRKLLIKFDIIDAKRAALAETTLQQHLDDFIKVLSIGNTAGHVKIQAQRIQSIVTGCKIRFFADIVGSKVKTFLADRTKSDVSCNYYLAAFQHFCKWMVEDGRANQNPVAYIKKIKVPRKQDKRPLATDEVDRLLVATENAPRRFGMTGYDRAVLYLLAAETGLRVRELQSLKVSSFDFDNYTVSLDGEFCKNRQRAEQPLKKKRAEQFRQYFAGRDTDDRAFPTMPDHCRTATMIRADLQDAGISVEDGAGRKVCFHSLRYTLGTELDRSRATIKERATIMRHSVNGSLTLSTYTVLQTYDLQQAVERLPDHNWPGSIKSKEGVA